MHNCLEMKVKKRTRDSNAADVLEDLPDKLLLNG
jgi:hypothetical protein